MKVLNELQFMADSKCMSALTNDKIDGGVSPSFTGDNYGCAKKS